MGGPNVPGIPAEGTNVVSQVWPARPEALAEIRAATRAWLSELGVVPHIGQDLLLAVNEAATNSVEHGYRDVEWPPGTTPQATVEVTMWTSLDSELVAHFAITDRGRWRSPSAEPSSDRGRGLVMMRALVESVHIQRDSSGTTTLLSHPLPDRPHPPAADTGLRSLS